MICDIISLALSSSTDHIPGDSVEEVCALLTGTREEVEEGRVISQGNRSKVTSAASQLDIAIEHFCKIKCVYDVYNQSSTI